MPKMIRRTSGRRPTWIHEDVLKHKKDYRSMTIRMGVPLSDIQEFGDAVDIIQSYMIEDKGGYRINWIKGPIQRRADTVYYVNMEIFSLSESENRPYEVDINLYRVEGDLYTTSYKDMRHECKAMQFPVKYKWKAGVDPPDMHLLVARRTFENNSRSWCLHHDVPSIEIPKLYTDVGEPHRSELKRIVEEERRAIKSVELRQIVYVYLAENDLKLYGLDQNAS